MIELGISIRIRILTLLLLLVAVPAVAAPLTGTVYDAATGEPLGAATVHIDETGQAALADSLGRFAFDRVPDGRYTLTATFVGYKPAKVAVTISGQPATADIYMQPTVLPGEEIIITTTRVSDRTDAVPHSNITNADIQRDYAVQDVPMLLNSQPGVYAYSDAGNGVGYSYMQVRGFDQRKVSVLLNGVPQNDPESHQMYWVDMPDLLESATDIQIQRGVGASLYGASAAGGVVSMEIDPFEGTPGISINSGVGSYGTQKFSVSGRSGLVRDRYAFYGRYSKIVSDGYRDQSWVDLWSYFIGVARYDRNLTNRFHAYGGPENLHLAYYGIDQATLDTNRKFNPLTYKDETDTFNQPHYELLTDWNISDGLTFSNTLFYIKGDGYYIQSDPWSTFNDLELTPIRTKDSTQYASWQYATVVLDTAYVFDPTDNKYHAQLNTTYRRDTTVTGDTLFTVNQYPDAVLQRWVQNDFFGIVPRFSLVHPHGTLQFGGSFDLHHGYHFGQLRSVTPAPAGFVSGQHYYDYDGRRASGILFAQEAYEPTPRLNVTTGLQFQWRRYSLRNDRRGHVRYDIDYTSLSPRLGVLYRLTDHHSAYSSLSYAQHEPAHDDIFKPRKLEDPALFFDRYNPVTGVASGPKMKAEKVTDLELGWRFRNDRVRFSANGFYEWFTNEIVDEGGIDIDGNPIRTNAGKTIHRGAEAQLAVALTKGIDVNASFTWSDNYFDEFKQFFAVDVPVERNDTVFLPATAIDSVDYKGNTIAGFPDVVANVGLDVSQPLSRRDRVRFLGGAQLRYVGRIFLDNAGNEAHSIDPVAVLNLRVGLQTGGLGIGRRFTAEFIVNNVTDELYSTSGYTYDGVAYYYPAAERNYYLRVRTDW